MDNWTTIHRYNKLVREGKAAKLVCPDCDGHLVTRIGKDDQPMLWCVKGDAFMYPGSNFWQALRSVVAEHYLE